MNFWTDRAHSGQTPPMSTVAPIRFKQPLARHDLGVPTELWGGVREIMSETRRAAEAFCTRAARLPDQWVDDAYAKSGGGRTRNLDRIAVALREPPLVRTPKVLLYRYVLARPHPLHAPAPSEPLRHMRRDGVEIRFLAFGALASGLSRADDGWFMAVSDHALGRLLQRSHEAPRSALLAAHDALLGMNAGEISLALEREQLVLPTLTGAFLARVAMVSKTTLPSLPGRERAFSIYVWASTFLNHEMMLPQQEHAAARLAGRTPNYLTGPLRCPALCAPVHLAPEMLQ